MSASRGTPARWPCGRARLRCRMTGVPVIKTGELRPDRGEVAHIVGRRDRVVRFDPRNLLLLSFEAHRRLDTHKVKVAGTAFFTAANGKVYVDATAPVRFIAVE